MLAQVSRASGCCSSQALVIRFSAPLKRERRGSFNRSRRSRRCHRSAASPAHPDRRRPAATVSAPALLYIETLPDTETLPGFTIFARASQGMWEQPTMTDTKPVRLGMIGSGFMGLTYSEAIVSQVTGAELAAVAGGRRAAHPSTRRADGSSQGHCSEPPAGRPAPACSSLQNSKYIDHKYEVKMHTIT